MKSLKEEYFDESEFGSVSATDLDVSQSWDKSDNPEDWVFVRARTQSRDVMLYEDGIYRVRRTQISDPITKDIEVLSLDEILDRMPRTLRQNKVVPSPSGEYITVAKVTSTEQSDGTIAIDTISQTKTIPVEFVKETLSYDKVVVELLNV